MKTIQVKLNERPTAQSIPTEQKDPVMSGRMFLTKHPFQLWSPKNICVLTLTTHGLARYSPAASFHFISYWIVYSKMQTTSFPFSPTLLPNSQLSLFHIYYPTVFSICLREQHNYIKWKAIVSGLYFRLGFDAHRVWQKDCDKIFCAFLLCTEW